MPRPNTAAARKAGNGQQYTSKPKVECKFDTLGFSCGCGGRCARYLAQREVTAARSAAAANFKSFDRLMREVPTTR